MNKAIKTDDTVARIFEDSDILAWLLRLPAVKAQAYFWNYSSRTERRKAMKSDMIADKSVNANL